MCVVQLIITMCEVINVDVCINACRAACWAAAKRRGLTELPVVVVCADLVLATIKKDKGCHEYILYIAAINDAVVSTSLAILISLAAELGTKYGYRL